MSFRLFAQRISLTALTNLLVNLSGLIILPLLSKNLPLFEYGIWIQYTSLIGILSMLVLLGLDSAVIRFLPGQIKSYQREILYSVCFTIIGFALIIIMIFTFFSGFVINFLNTSFNVIIVGILLPFYSINLIFLDFFLANQHIKKYSLFLLLQSYGDIFLFVLLIKYGIVGVILSVLLNRIFNFILMAILVIKEAGFTVPHFHHEKSLFKYSIPLFVGSLSAWVISSSDKLVINLFKGISSAGLYGPGYTIGTLIGIISTPLLTLLTPTITNFYEKGNLEQVKLYLSLSLKYLLFLMIPALFGLTILSNHILLILTTQEIANASSLVVPLVAVGNIFYSVAGIVAQIYYLEKKTFIIRNAMVMGAISSIIMNLILIPIFGIIGAAFTNTIAYGVIMIINIYYSRGFFTVNWIFIIKSILASLIMTIFIYIFNSYSIISILFLIIISICIYFICLYLFKGFDNTDITLIKSIFDFNKL